MMNMEYWVVLGALLSVFMGGVMTPGPDFILIIRNSLKNRITGIFTGTGLATGVFIHASYTIFGIGYILRDYPEAKLAVKILGSSYLLYLGITILRTAFSKKKFTEADLALDTAIPEQKITKSKAWQMGFLTNFLNVFAALFMISLFSNINTSVSILAKYSYAFLCALTYIIYNIFIALFLSHKKLRQRFLAQQKHLEKISGILLIGYSVYFIHDYILIVGKKILMYFFS